MLYEINSLEAKVYDAVQRVGARKGLLRKDLATSDDSLEAARRFRAWLDALNATWR